MKKVRLVWSEEAKEDLAEIRQYIAQDAPLVARDFIARLKAAANRLRVLPESGTFVPELQNPEVREIFYGSYRIVYRYREKRVRILTVIHGSRLLFPGIVHIDE